MSCVSCLLVRSEMLGPPFKTLKADHIYSWHNRQKVLQQVPTHLSLKPKTFSGVITAFLKSNLHIFNISGVIHAEKCGSLNARMILFHNTPWKLTCQGVLNTAHLCATALVNQLSNNMKQSELCIMSLSPIWNVGTVF